MIEEFESPQHILKIDHYLPSCDCQASMTPISLGIVFFGGGVVFGFMSGLLTSFLQWDRGSSLHFGAQLGIFFLWHSIS